MLEAPKLIEQPHKFFLLDSSGAASHESVPKELEMTGSSTLSPLFTTACVNHPF